MASRTNPTTLPAQVDLAGLSDAEIAALQNVASGAFKTWTAAFKAAGYSEASASARASTFRRKRGGKYEQWRNALQWAVSERFSLLAADALSNLQRLMTCGKPQVEVRAAEAILDRSGFGKEASLFVHHRDENPELRGPELLHALESQCRSLGANLTDDERARLIRALQAGAGDAKRPKIAHNPAPALDVDFTEVTE